MLSATGNRRPTRIAILGADGFIGSHAMQLLRGSGGSPLGFCVKDAWRLNGQDHRLVPVPGGEWWEEAFLVQLEAALEQIDALLLLAYTAPPEAGREAWEAHERTVNVYGAERILDLTTRAKVRLVFASSADVYGPARTGLVDEEAEPQPATPYARAKREVEEMVQQAAASGDACALRISTVYGPKENGPRAIPSFIRALLSGEKPTIHGAGTDVRDYVHVRDVGIALRQAALIEPGAIRESRGIFNVGSGVGRSTVEVLSTVASVIGGQATGTHVPSTRAPSQLVLDPTRSQRLLGFRASEDFESGVREEAEWLRRWISESRRASGDAR